MNIYFSGVGGVGIGPLALLARDLGYDVVGSDFVKSPYTDVIEAAGIPVYFEQTRNTIAKRHALQPIDWYIHTAALPLDNPELAFAHEHGIRTSKRDEFINKVIDEHKLKLIAVAGTHGKTNTTGMLIWAFKQLGIPVSYLIGTNISFGASGHY